MAKSEKLTIRLDPDTLEFINELRKKNSDGSNYASKSETVRRIISDWAFRMMQPIPPRMADMVIDEDRLAGVLEERGWEVSKGDDEKD